MKRRAWTAKDVRTLKKLAGKRTRAANIARTLRRTEGNAAKSLYSWAIARNACCKALTKEQSELKLGPAQNRSEGFEGQGRIYKATHSAFFGAARPNKYHAMRIFGFSDMFPTAFLLVLHSNIGGNPSPSSSLSSLAVAVRQRRHSSSGLAVIFAASCSTSQRQLFQPSIDH